MKKIIFSTNSNPELAKKLCKKYDFSLGKCDVKKFADQEISVFLKESVKNKDVWVLGSTFPPADNSLELLILVHTLKANGAKKVSLIIPYFAYAKADRVNPPGASAAAELMVQAIELAGTDEITAVNLHSSRVEKFFKKPLTHLSAMPLLAKHFENKKILNLAIASPDRGGVSRAKEFSKKLGINKIILAEKHHPDFDEVEITKISGEIQGKNVIIVDDMIQSGGTIIKAVQALKNEGAQNIFVAVTHLVSTGPSIEILNKEKNIAGVVITDTIPPKEKLPSKFEVVSVVDLICGEIK